MYRHPRLLLGALTIVASACATAPHAPSSVAGDDRYLFSYFKGNGEDGLHLAYSEDGLTWRALNHDSAFFKPTVGRERLTRDPSIVRGP